VAETLDRLLKGLTSLAPSRFPLRIPGYQSVSPVVDEYNLIFNGPEQLVTRSFGATLDTREDAKLVVFGLPKSGNVWLVSLLANYLSVPVIDPIVDVGKSGVGMCHHFYSEELARRRDFVQAVYLVRDLRDVIVSYYHNAQTEWFRSMMPNFDYPDIDSFFYEFFLPRVVPRHRIADHAQEFAERGVPVVRYERLLADAEGEFGRILRRLGIAFDSARVRSVVEENSFDRLKKAGKHLNTYVPPSHFRRGKSGGYRDEMPESIRRHVSRMFSKALLRWGYEPDDY
jgi:hypothetical protein